MTLNKLALTAMILAGAVVVLTCVLSLFAIPVAVVSFVFLSSIPGYAAAMLIAGGIGLLYATWLVGLGASNLVGVGITEMSAENSPVPAVKNSKLNSEIHENVKNVKRYKSILTSLDVLLHHENSDIRARAECVKCKIEQEVSKSSGRKDNLYPTNQKDIQNFVGEEDRSNWLTRLENFVCEIEIAAKVFILSTVSLSPPSLAFTSFFYNKQDGGTPALTSDQTSLNYNK